jgi:hypothetical protein
MTLTQKQKRQMFLDTHSKYYHSNEKYLDSDGDNLVAYIQSRDYGRVDWVLYSLYCLGRMNKPDWEKAQHLRDALYLSDKDLDAYLEFAQTFVIVPETN